MDAIGIASIPNQLHAVSASTPFEFTVMCLGETGLGKSTFLNSLFASDIYSLSPYPSASADGSRIPQTTELIRRTVDLNENGVQLKLTTIDMPGFGNAMNNDGCWDPIVKVLESGHLKYMNSESQVARSSFTDCRVHCCIYFVAPSTRGLKALDIAVLKRIQNLVNIVLVVGRADMFTQDEQKLAKAKILADLKEHNILTLAFEDEESNIKVTSPYCLSASIVTDNVDGKPVRVRRYPWGTLDATDEEQSDFAALRRMLISTFMYDMIVSTHEVHYENFRKSKLGDLQDLQDGGDEGSGNNATPIAKWEALKRHEEANLQQIESSLQKTFEQTSAEKEKMLNELEKELLQEHDNMQKELVQFQRKLEEDRNAFENEKMNAKIEADAVVPPPPSGKRGKRLFK